MNQLAHQQVLLSRHYIVVTNIRLQRIFEINEVIFVSDATSLLQGLTAYVVTLLVVSEGNVKERKGMGR